MNWDAQGPLVAALAAAVVWLSLELKRAQGDLSSKVDVLLAAKDSFFERAARMYEERIAELRQILEAQRPLES